jgi:hypothetical protein
LFAFRGSVTASGTTLIVPLANAGPLRSGPRDSLGLERRLDRGTELVPIPSTIALRGSLFYVQTLHDEGTTSLASSPLLSMTVL